MKSPTEEQNAAIIKLANEGYTIRQISIELGIKDGTIKIWRSELERKGLIHFIPRHKKIRPYIGTIAEMERVLKEDKKSL